MMNRAFIVLPSLTFAAMLALATPLWAQPIMRADAPPRVSAKPMAQPKAVTSNPCANHGAGFVRIEGTDTCVKVGGSVSIGTGWSR